MLKRLEELSQRYVVVEEMVQEPDLVKDPKKYKEVMREHSYLSELMSAYQEYKKLLQDIKGNQEIITEEDDPDMKEMAREELKELEAKQPEMESKLKMMLIPPDPLEEKNIIMVRGAVPGASILILIWICSRPGTLPRSPSSCCLAASFTSCF